MLKEKSGHIVNLSSVAGRIVFAGGTVYCATKHAMTAFSEGLRKELSPKNNIRVTCIEPGAVSQRLLQTITDESMSGFIESYQEYGNVTGGGHCKCGLICNRGTKSCQCQ